MKWELSVSSMPSQASQETILEETVQTECLLQEFMLIEFKLRIYIYIFSLKNYGISKDAYFCLVFC